MILRRIIRRFRFAILLIRTGGFRVFLHQLQRQIYSRTTYYAMVKNLDTDITKVEAKIQYTLQLASKEDMDDVLNRVRFESKESTHELIQRIWFYESGFDECYIAKAADSGEPCHIHWMLFPRPDELRKRGFRGRLPILQEDEVLGENAYTFEKYRGYRLAAAAGADMYEIARSRGAKRWIGYVREDNIAMQKSEERSGFQKFGEMHELKLLFFTMRKHQ
ncbi:MAG: hypothetical protein JSV77_00065 [Dehalococcoidales bacterium]|nr:MAG: hypothetical protein JSV77_00065 [Dehalococcoidales bacterium]